MNKSISLPEMGGEKIQSIHFLPWKPPSPLFCQIRGDGFLPE
ncbi:hypothetical protein MC7420_6851 [Coleofasciculus chthonoplastes PCC 7420]|uniref:Uncharacterized protein n=1 Tax=Coleofasciculus chthonoplastes PCC 7420 TaxID=118168 RepID=B4VWP2_9CYAN|nr:hypothetical protein MC7420_6851 [Coleofasciculus chthonoplastes PCC 7420]